MANHNELKEMAAEILKAAEDSGVQSNYFFVTTFDRYQTQLAVLEKLKAEIEADGVIVTKEYVRGARNVYTSPAVTEYNRTTDSANKTVSTLMKIIKNFEKDGDSDDQDPLIAALSGGGSGE
jgi:hypothetical protein